MIKGILEISLGMVLFLLSWVFITVGKILYGKDAILLAIMGFLMYVGISGIITGMSNIQRLR